MRRSDNAGSFPECPLGEVRKRKRRKRKGKKKRKKKRKERADD